MKKILQLTALFTGLLLIGAGCVLYQQSGNTNSGNENVNAVNENINSNENGNLDENTNTNVTSGTNTNTSSTTDEIDTSEWLTYSSDEYNLNFKYPKNYLVSVSKSTKGDFIDDSGTVFIIQKKITDLPTDPVRITLYDHIVEHPTSDDINSVQFGPGPARIGEYYDHVISETSYSVDQYSGKKFRIKDLTGSNPVDEDHKLKDVAELYYLNSNSRTILVRLTDDAATGVGINTVLNTIEF